MQDEKIINAAGRSLGRVAGEVAGVLMGKDKPDFERHCITGDKVVVENASQLTLSEKKLNGKVYTRYTGYPGGLREETMREILEKKGYEELLKKAVYGMLPPNKLRQLLLKRLVIKN